MPRHGGSTRRTPRHKHQGHRMHRRTRVARRRARINKGRSGGRVWGKRGLT